MAQITVDKRDLVSRAKALDADAVWFTENIEELRKKYAERYVAVHNETVIDAHRDLRKLLSRLKQAYPAHEVGNIFIQYVTKSKIDLII